MQDAMSLLTVRRATPDDSAAVEGLLERYYAEWDIWERDAPEVVRSSLAAPQLGFYLACGQGTALGCVLGRPCPSVAGAAECKRLFVRPEARGFGIARLLMNYLEQEARAAGFRSMYLDTKDEFSAAIALYERLGYSACARYNDNPQATMFFRKQL